MAPPKQTNLYADRGSVLYISVWVTAAIAILALIGRFVSRKMKGQRWLIDDWAALLALVSAYAYHDCRDQSANGFCFFLLLL